MRWDDESRLRVVISLIALVVGAYVYSTTEPTYFLHLPAVALVVFAIWGIVLAFVPAMRGKRGTPHRVLIVVTSWAIVLSIIVIVGRAAVSH
jgi:hypothetical protein